MLTCPEWQSSVMPAREEEQQPSETGDDAPTVSVPWDFVFTDITCGWRRLILRERPRIHLQPPRTAGRRPENQVNFEAGQGHVGIDQPLMDALKAVTIGGNLQLLLVVIALIQAISCMPRTNAVLRGWAINEMRRFSVPFFSRCTTVYIYAAPNCQMWQVADW